MAASKTQNSKAAFGKRLTAAREAKGLTKEKLGKVVGVHHSQVGRYEKGEASPSAEVLKKMANALDVSTDYLMNGTTADLAAENITDKTLINQFNRISELSPDNKTVVSKLIDAFLFQQEMKQKLAQ
ncbi:MAG TPA: helix-turn-helix transcriptional regulator [Chitinophagaceae bacterium]|nr:helix-turn-helix transcriptional regulator [Chitinophagaceae bacterium]